jgi:hypothetical protein
LDGTPVEDTGLAALFVSSRDLARYVDFRPNFDDPETLWQGSEAPYTSEHQVKIMEMLLAARQSELVALSPTATPTSAWQIFKAVRPEPGSATEAIARLENAFQQFRRLGLLHQESAREEFARRWDLEWMLDSHATDLLYGSQTLYLRSTLDASWQVSPVVVVDLPDDGLPYAILPDPGEVSPSITNWDGPLIGVHVVTKLGLEDLGRQTAEGLSQVIDRGVYVNGHFSMFRDNSSDTERFAILAPEVAGEAEMDPTSTSGLLQVVLVNLWLSQIRDLANDLLTGFLLDPPRLQYRFSVEPVDVVGGTTFSWTTSDGIPLRGLSKAEKSWVTLSLRLAILALTGGNPLQGFPTPTAHDLRLANNTFVIVDEPEAALHRAAEAHMAQGLAALASHSDFYLVVATHSPHILNLTSAHVQRVHREAEVFVEASPDEPDEGIGPCRLLSGR